MSEDIKKDAYLARQRALYEEARKDPANQKARKDAQEGAARMLRIDAEVKEIIAKRKQG